MATTRPFCDTRKYRDGRGVRPDGLAAWSNLQGERTTNSFGADQARRRPYRPSEDVQDRRQAREQHRHRQRFIVKAQGDGIVRGVRNAVAALDLGKPEAMKDVGVE